MTVAVSNSYRLHTETEAHQHAYLSQPILLVCLRSLHIRIIFLTILLFYTSQCGVRFFPVQLNRLLKRVFFKTEFPIALPHGAILSNNLNIRIRTDQF